MFFASYQSRTDVRETSTKATVRRRAAHPLAGVLPFGMMGSRLGVLRCAGRVGFGIPGPGPPIPVPAGHPSVRARSLIRVLRM